MFKLGLHLILIFLTLSITIKASAIEALNDEELDNIIGQSLFITNYIPEGGTNPSGDTSFYRIQLDARIDLNANINKLALGCDGPNGTGICDINIDRLGLTGIAGTEADAGVMTDFVLSRPFFEFAIKNPKVAATREVVGIRFGAQEAFGMMSFGYSPSTVDNDPSHHAGINTLSGDLTAYINNAQLPVSLCLLGNANDDRTGCTSGIATPLGNATINSNQPNTGDNIFQVITNRDSSLSLSPVVAIVVGILSLHADFNEALSFVHNLTMGTDSNNNKLYDEGEGTKDFYLSVQKQAVTWPKVSTGNFANAIPAQKGWWMSLPSVTLGDFTGRRVYAGTAEALGNVLGGPNIVITNVDLNQRPVDNCWGNLSFC